MKGSLRLSTPEYDVASTVQDPETCLYVEAFLSILSLLRKEEDPRSLHILRGKAMIASELFFVLHFSSHRGYMYR